MILIAEGRSADTLAFNLDAWGYTKVHNAAKYSELTETWQQLTLVINEIVSERFAVGPVKWLRPDEVDARYAGKIST